MTSSSFVGYLKDSNLLHQASYQELKTLSLQYPYCQNLQLLLLKKSYLNNHDDSDKNLERTASCTVDRTQLYHQMTAIGKEELNLEPTFLMEEDYLELTNLEPVATASSEPLEEPQAITKEWPSREGIDGRPAPKEQDDTFTFEVSDNVVPAENTLSPIVEQPKRYIIDQDGLLDLIAIATILPQVPAALTKTEERKEEPILSERTSTRHAAPTLHRLKQKDRAKLAKIHANSRLSLNSSRPEPRPKQSFNSWLQQFQDPSAQLDHLMEHSRLSEVQKERKQRKKKKTPPKVVIQSITENKEVASETLAKLLVLQGQSKKARQMYEQLMLLFPEKNSYFAAKIEELEATSHL